MASTNKTSHYNLSQYVGSDKPTYLVDYNGDMLNIDNAIYSADSKAIQNSTNIGDITTLTTSDKSSVVNAINETKNETETNTNNIGLLSNLNTTNKTNIVSALNEVNNKFSDLVDILYPIGSLYFNTTNVNPGTFLGGTWELFAPGRVLVGYDSTDTDFDTLLETGGSKDLQAHNHSGIFTYGALNVGSANVGSGSAFTVARLTTDAVENMSTPNAGTGNSGNLQPYIVVSIWKRTV